MMLSHTFSQPYPETEAPAQLDLFGQTPMQFWAFLENSDFVRHNRDGTFYRMDEVRLIRHDEHLEADYALLTSIGMKGVRDAARWYLSHPAPGRYDWAWMDRMMESAERHGLTMYIDLWHYGYPDWLDIQSPDAPRHFADFAAAIADRYPTLDTWCICNEPSLLLELGGRQGVWSPHLKLHDVTPFRQQVCRMIIEASKAVLAIRPDALLVLPEPWHATDTNPEDNQAAVFDTVLGLRDPELGGEDRLISVIGLNHYRDSTLPPLHRLLINAGKRYPHKPIWVTETSGPPVGWQQTEWFWWMLSETRLANIAGVKTPVFTWAPVISMFDWVDETVQLHNGIWILDGDGARLPNGRMLEAIALARQYHYLE
ncbi:MAG: beta-galactosidase [bacterium]|nr:beta-galactosidase [bacterium]